MSWVYSPNKIKHIAYRCGLQSAICSGTKVKFKHRGPCLVQEGNRYLKLSSIATFSRQMKSLFSSGGARCAEEKQRALAAGAESGIPVFVPSCDEEGGYQQIQCHHGEMMWANMEAVVTSDNSWIHLFKTLRSPPWCPFRYMSSLQNLKLSTLCAVPCQVLFEVHPEVLTSSDNT